jgi:hypothetical protein
MSEYVLSSRSLSQVASPAETRRLQSGSSLLYSCVALLAACHGKYDSTGSPPMGIGAKLLITTPT